MDKVILYGKVISGVIFFGIGGVLLELVCMFIFN